MKCPLCSSSLKVKKDDVYFDCVGCRALVKNRLQLPDAASEKARYTEHLNDVLDPAFRNFTKPIWHYILEHYPKNAQGLDFGSGTGPVISTVLQEKAYHVEQYDPYFAPNEELLNRKYDYIFACEVVEHFYEPNKEFAQLHKMLKKGAELLLMTYIYHDGIDFSNWHYRRDPTHVFIYRKETFKYIAKEFDLDLMHIDNRFVIFSKSLL